MTIEHLKKTVKRAEKQYNEKTNTDNFINFVKKAEEITSSVNIEYGQEWNMMLELFRGTAWSFQTRVPDRYWLNSVVRTVKAPIKIGEKTFQLYLMLDTAKANDNAPRIVYLCRE